MSSADIHDRLFKATFKDKELAAAEFRALLPKALVDMLDFDNMVIEESMFVDDDLKSRQCDILYRIPLFAGGEAFIWLLFEHQSRNQKFMGLKFLGYMVAIWERWRKDHKDAEALPIIIPLVLQHDPAGWKAPTKFSDLYQGPAALVEALRPFIVDFEYIIDDLTKAQDQELIDRPGPPAMPVTLLTLKARADIEPRHYNLLTRAFTALAAAGKDEIVRAILRYSALAAKDGEPIAVTAAADADEGYRRIAMSYAEQLRREGNVQAKAEGKAEGRKAVMVSQIGLKFGAPGPATIERINKGSEEDLDRWTERILTATGLEEFFQA